MTKITFSSAAFLLGLLPAIASAQSALSDPSVPGSGYQVPQVAQAVGQRHDGCGAEAARLRNTVDMRISHSGGGDNSWTAYSAFLQAAANAGTAGDGATCAYWLGRYRAQR